MAVPDLSGCAQRAGYADAHSLNGRRAHVGVRKALAPAPLPLDHPGWQCEYCDSAWTVELSETLSLATLKTCAGYDPLPRHERQDRAVHHQGGEPLHQLPQGEGVQAVRLACVGVLDGVLDLLRQVEGISSFHLECHRCIVTVHIAPQVHDNRTAGGPLRIPANVRVNQERRNTVRPIPKALGQAHSVATGIDDLLEFHPNDVISARGAR